MLRLISPLWCCLMCRVSSFCLSLLRCVFYQSCLPDKSKIYLYPLYFFHLHTSFSVPYNSHHTYTHTHFLDKATSKAKKVKKKKKKEWDSVWPKLYHELLITIRSHMNRRDKTVDRRERKVHLPIRFDLIGFVVKKTLEIAPNYSYCTLYK